MISFRLYYHLLFLNINVYAVSLKKDYYIDQN
jgi:hypothetical protein